MPQIALEISRDRPSLFLLTGSNYLEKSLCSQNSWLGSGLTAPRRLALHMTKTTSPTQLQPLIKNIAGNALFHGAKFGDVWQLRISQAVFHCSVQTDMLASTSTCWRAAYSKNHVESNRWHFALPNVRLRANVTSLFIRKEGSSALFCGLLLLLLFF